MERENSWLEPESPAPDVLLNHLASKNFQSKIKQAARATYTGALVSFRSLILAYTSKRADFDPASYSGGVALAIITNIFYYQHY